MLEKTKPSSRTILDILYQELGFMQKPEHFPETKT